MKSTNNILNMHVDQSIHALAEAAVYEYVRMSGGVLTTAFMTVYKCIHDLY